MQPHVFCDLEGGGVAILPYASAGTASHLSSSLASTSVKRSYCESQAFCYVGFFVSWLALRLCSLRSKGRLC